MALHHGLQYVKWKIRYFFTIRSYGLNNIKQYNRLNFSNCTTQEILSAAKHDAHRIEKAFYAGYFRTTKLSAYHVSSQNISRALNELNNRNINLDQPDIKWITEIRDAFFDMESYIESRKSPAPPSIRKIDTFIAQTNQTKYPHMGSSNFTETELIQMGEKLIESASWAPCSATDNHGSSKSSPNKVRKIYSSVLKKSIVIRLPC